MWVGKSEGKADSEDLEIIGKIGPKKIAWKSLEWIGLVGTEAGLLYTI